MIIKNKNRSSLPYNPNAGVSYENSTLRDIWFAGGCFWGVQAYFARIYGVAETSVGYANGKSEHTSYHELSKTGHSETVHIRYDPLRVSLETLLLHYFMVIDPTSINKQGADIGTQYRTGIYYKNDEDQSVISEFIAAEQKKHKKPIVTEVEKLQNYHPAEDYHQDYLENNPQGYCHINFSTLNSAPPDVKAYDYQVPNQSQLKATLLPMQYKVTQENHTEPPFNNAFWNHYKKGIYVDIVTGEPLFLSSDQFDSGCGWPSFSKPVNSVVLKEITDNSFGNTRIEVRSRVGNSHLGHVFPDGPEETGGLRYCINSASLRFIPSDQMEKEGYGNLIPYVR